MTYKIKYVEGKNLHLLEKDWKELQHGKEMTLFQSYEWFQTLLKYYIPEDTNEFESCYAVVEKNDTPCIIAPLWIIKRRFRLLNQKGVYLLGRGSFSDYLNFVYYVFNADAFDCLLKDLSLRYGVKFCTFENLKEDTSLYRHVVANYEVIVNSESPCVGLRLPCSVEEYHIILSKNSRQNLRTAQNRLKKDGESLIYNFDDQHIDRNRCMEIRESKLSVKYSQTSLYFKYKYRILNRLRYMFPGFNPIITFPDSKLMTACDKAGNLRAFFNYSYDSNKTCIRVMAAGTDLDFARYSPGMLLMYNFILNAIKEGKMKEVDFTRGDEKYKFSLGGQQRLNHTLKIRIRKQSTTLHFS